MGSSEALLRIEHKLDTLLSALQAQAVILPPEHIPQLEGYDGDVCPVCGKNIRITISTVSEDYNRTCGCSPPIQVVSGISEIHHQSPTISTQGTRADEEQTQSDG